MMTWATAIEAEMIRGQIEKEFGDDQRLSLVSRIDESTVHHPGPIVFGERYSDDVLSKFHKSRTFCPFLSRKNSCTVYESRPFECRKVIAFSAPSKCKTLGKINSYDAAYFPYIYTALECLSLLVYQELNYRRYLPSWFINELEI